MALQLLGTPKKVLNAVTVTPGSQTAWSNIEFSGVANRLTVQVTHDTAGDSRVLIEGSLDGTNWSSLGDFPFGAGWGPNSDFSMLVGPIIRIRLAVAIAEDEGDDVVVSLSVLGAN